MMDFLKWVSEFKKRRFERRWRISKDRIGIGGKWHSRFTTSASAPERGHGTILKKIQLPDKPPKIPKNLYKPLAFLFLLVVILVFSLIGFSILSMISQAVTKEPAPTGYSTYRLGDPCSSDFDCVDIVDYRCRNQDVYKYTIMVPCVDSKCVQGDTQRGLKDVCREDEVCVDGEDQCQPKPTTTSLLSWQETMVVCSKHPTADERDDCYLKLAVNEEDALMCNMIEDARVKYECFGKLGGQTSQDSPESSETTAVDESEIKCASRRDCPDDRVEYTCDPDGNVVKSVKKYYCAVYSGSTCTSRVAKEVVDECTEDEECVRGVDHCKPL